VNLAGFDVHLSRVLWTEVAYAQGDEPSQSRRWIMSDFGATDLQLCAAPAIAPARSHTGRDIPVSPLAYDARVGGHAAGELLSDRERDVLRLVSYGLTNKEVAKELGVAPETIKSHIKHIFRKLSVERRSHAVSQGHSLGLIELPPR
jgi:ATP/maltotriose-dependent transcriptional regulator MalT